MGLGETEKIFLSCPQLRIMLCYWLMLGISPLELHPSTRDIALDDT